MFLDYYADKLSRDLETVPVLNDNLVNLMLQAFHMPLWNNKIKPIKFVEADRQFQATVCGWLLLLKKNQMSAKIKGFDTTKIIEELSTSEIKFVELVIFEFITRVIITDINPMVISRFKDGDKKCIGELKNSILKRIEKLSEAETSCGFWDDYRAWINDEFLHPTDCVEALCYDAGNAYASEYEYNIIDKLGLFDYEKSEIQKRFSAKREVFYEKMSEKGKGKKYPSYLQIPSSINFIMDFCGTFRSQQRWALVPRTPETTVQGHMFMVGVVAYFTSLDLGIGKKRATQNFLSALVHDFGEGFVKDIISPVKSISNIEQIAKTLENENIYRYVIAPLKTDGENLIAKRIMFLLSLGESTDHYDKIKINGVEEKCTVSEFHSTTLCPVCNNFDVYDSAVINDESSICKNCQASVFTRDGEIINFADKISAYIEIVASVMNGVGQFSLNDAIKILNTNTKRMLDNIVLSVNGNLNEEENRRFSNIK